MSPVIPSLTSPHVLSIQTSPAQHHETEYFRQAAPHLIHRNPTPRPRGIVPALSGSKATFRGHRRRRDRESFFCEKYPHLFLCRRGRSDGCCRM